MKIIMTGGTGFLGKWIVKEALEQHEIILLVRDLKKAQILLEGWLRKSFVDIGHNIQLIKCDMNQLEDLDLTDFDNKKFDVFYHFGWQGTSGLARGDVSMQLSNIKYTCAAVKLAEQLECKTFVNAGSIMEYETLKILMNDGVKPTQSNIYSTAKISSNFMASTLANHTNMNYCNLIISNVYGPGEKSARFLNTILRKMLNNETILLTHGTQLYDFIYAADAARAILLTGELGQNNWSYYIGNSSQRSLKDFIVEMKTIVGSISELRFGAIEFTGCALSYQEFCTDNMQKKLGYSPETNFEQGIQLMKEWMLHNE